MVLVAVLLLYWLAKERLWMNETTKYIDFDVVEREQPYVVCDELSLGMSGLIDPATAAQAGHMLGAQYVLCGSLNGLSTSNNNEVSDVPHLYRWREAVLMTGWS